MSSRRGSFAELVALAERAGQSEALPALALAGVRNIAELAANTDRLVEAGISPVTLEALLAAPLYVEATSDLAVATAGPSRPDLPVRRGATRASLAAAVEAVRPANVKRAITARTLEVIGAAFRAGAYRSAKEYFLAAFRYQEHDLRLEVDPLLRRFANRVIKAIVRGLPGSRLKEAFPLPALAPLVSFADRAAFDPTRAAHSADVFVIAVWFMLREIEVAAARVSDMVVSPGLVVLDLPLHKTATGGELTLTRRSLRCACGAATHPLCPVHAAMRHLVRLGAAGMLASAGPLFPGKGGGTRSKEDSVSFLRGVLETAGLVTLYQDANGIERQVFGGHACRVAGATFLASSPGRHPAARPVVLQGHRAVHAVGAVGAGAVGARTPWRARRQEGQGAGHSWLSRSPWPTTEAGPPDEATVGCPGVTQEAPQEEAGPSAGLPGVQFVPAVRPERGGPKQTGGRSILKISPGRGAYTSPTRTRPTRTGRLGAQWAAAGRTAGVSSFGCPLRPPARPFAVAASRRGWKAAARLWRVLRARPPGPRGPPPSSHRASSTSESGGSTSDS